jgi:hypothetical protein
MSVRISESPGGDGAPEGSGREVGIGCPEANGIRDGILCDRWVILENGQGVAIHLEVESPVRPCARDRALKGKLYEAFLNVSFIPDSFVAASLRSVRVASDYYVIDIDIDLAVRNSASAECASLALTMR